MPVALVAAGYFARQFRKPTGPLGRLVVALMNRSHSSLTTWALGHVTIGVGDSILDIGCGGGRTLQRLAALAAHLGKVSGIDYAGASVAASRSLNRAAIEAGHVDVQLASVQQLPFPDSAFDLATAFETHYYWPGPPRRLSRNPACPQARRQLGSRRRGLSRRAAARPSASRSSDARRHKPHRRGTSRDLHPGHGFTAVDVITDPSKGWLCALGTKPLS